MIRIISIILFGLILSQSCFPQQQLFGSKISGNGDIISDIILIQDGFVLDSAVLNIFNDAVYDYSKKHRFEYYEDGRLKRDIFLPGLGVQELVNDRYITIYHPGCDEYFYNEKGYIDSTIRYYWFDTIWINYYCVDYSYDDNGNLLNKIYSNSEEIWRTEKNSYDSFGNLILIEEVAVLYNDTTYEIREYDFQNRIKLKKNLYNGTSDAYQYIYNYDFSGNINCTYQRIQIGAAYNYVNYYFEFDESGRVENEIMSENYIDSAWSTSSELLFVYDNYGKILEMGDLSFYHYNQDGNLDTFKVLHPIYSGYLGNKATFIDFYGNEIIFPNYFGTNYFYYSSLTTGIEENKTDNMVFNLSQNYPNPFNPTTRIDYHLANRGHVTLKVYDILGREIAELVNEFKTAGTYSVQFDGSNHSSGVYFYSINAGDNRQVKKMLLTK